MDFSALVAELRNIANKYHGRDTDANVSTAMYCEMFRKILQKANMGTTSYGDQIVILWMTLSQLRNTAEALSACSARDSLYQHIFLLCAKTVLNIKWQQLEDEELKSKQNLRATVEATHSQLQLAGFDRFGLLLPLMDDPWTDPVLSQIMAGEDTESDEAKEYITKEDSLILKLRVEMLIQESCEEFALNLCECCLEHDKFKDDLELTQKQLFLLFKLNNTDRLQEVCEKIPCHTGIKIILKMEQKESNQAICVRLIQTFLVQDWVNPDRNCCTNELLKLWIRHQYLTDKNKEKFLESVWAIAKLSSNTSQICVLVTGLQKECGFSLLQLYTDLLVFAINFDKGQCEQEMLKGHMDGVKKHQLAISNTCKKLTELYEVVNPKIAKVGILTAFALNATGQSLLAVKKTFCDNLNEGRKHGPGLCPADCISPECRRKKFMCGKTDRKSKEELYNESVNPATLHEVERLLNMLRPYYLNPELSWQKLQSVCYKFLAEKGLPGHDKQKETVVKEDCVITGNIQKSDNSKSINAKSLAADQTKTASVKSSVIQSPEMSPSILGPTVPSIKTSTSTSNPQVINSYQNMFMSSLSTPATSNLNPSLVNQRQSASSSKLHQQQRTASQQSVAELLAQTAVPYSTLKSSKSTVSPLSADLAHLEKQIKISTLLAESAAQKSSKSLTKSNKQSGQASGSKVLVSKVNEADKQKQQLKTSTTSSVFNLISLEDIKKQLRDAQIAATNAHKIVQIPVTMQSGFIVQQPPQVVTYRPPNPTNVKSQPRQRRPRILSNTPRVGNQQQLMHTDLNLIQKQGNAINKAMQVNQSVSKAMQISQSAAKLMQINQSATTVQPNQNLLNQSAVQTSQNLLQTVTNQPIQAGIINQGLTILHTKPFDNTVGASLSSIKQVSHGQTINQSSQLVTTANQSTQPSTTNPGVASTFYIGNMLQTPIQIASMQNVSTASGADVFNLIPQSVTMETNKLSGFSKVATQVFTPSATSSDKLSNIKPPSATISMNKSTTDWSNVKPPSSSLNVTYNSQLKTINAASSFSTTSTVSFPPYQRQASVNSPNIAGNTVSSSSTMISTNTSTVKKSNEGSETLPSDVVNLLVQENPKPDSISNKNAKLQLAMKAAERRPSADELKSIVDWLQTGTEDAVNKPVVTMASNLVNKAIVGKSTIKSPFETVKTKLVLTPPQTTLTIQSLSSLQFVDRMATSKPGNTQLTTVHCNTQGGNKPLILSSKSQNQFATNFLGTVVNTGKQSTSGGPQANTATDQNSTSTNVSVTMTTTNNNTISSSNVGSSTKNVASTVLFPFTSLSSASPSNITILDSSKLRAENIKQLLYLGQIKSGPLNVQPTTTAGSAEGQKQQWPEIGAVMSSAKQIVQELYARKSTTTASQPEATASSLSGSTTVQGTSTNIQEPSRNIQGLSSTIQEPSRTSSASTNFAESSNSLFNKKQEASTSSAASQVEYKQLTSGFNTGLVSEGKGTVEGEQKNNTDNDNSRELLTKVVENELKQIIVQADTSVVSGTAKQKPAEPQTEMLAAGLRVNRLTTSTDLDITESENGHKDDTNKNLGKSVSEKKLFNVTNNVKCSVEDNSFGDKVTSNELVVPREEVVEEIVDIETTMGIDISQRDLILSDSEVLSNNTEKNAKSENGQGQSLSDVNRKVGVSDTNLSEKAKNVNIFTKSSLHSEHSNPLGKSEDVLSECDTSYLTDTDKGVTDDSLQCLICKKIFVSVETLKDHVRDICKPTLTSESQFYSCIYYCSNCSYRSESKAYMALHIKDCENTVYTEHNLKLPNIYKRFSCRMCGQICLNKDNVLEHISNDCRHRKVQGLTTVDGSATTLKLTSNDEDIGLETKNNDSKGIKDLSEAKDGTLDDDYDISVVAEDDNVTVDVDGETTDDLQSDYEVDETTPENKRKKWFLRNRESRSYEELDENMAKIEEELSNQGTVESKPVSKSDLKSVEGETTLVKRGRGRPRIHQKKVLIKKTMNKNMQDGTVVKRKRGRPRIYKRPEEVTPEDLAADEDSLPQNAIDKTKPEDKSIIQKQKNVLKRKIKNDFPICHGKRIIKVAKLFSDYELPDFVKAQAEKCNVKRQFHSRNRIFTHRLKNVFTDRERKNLRNEKSPHKTSIRTKTTKCMKCGQVFRDHNVMLQHVASVHLSPYKSTWNKNKKKFCFLCRYCPNYFNTYIKFLDHVTLHSDKLLKQLEGKNIKGKKDMVNLKKLARQEQIASLSVKLDQDFNEKADHEENLTEVDNLKERLTRTSRASSVSSCDTDSSRKKKTSSRLKLEFSKNNISEESDKDTNKIHTSTIKTRRKAYSCQINDSVSETTEEDKNTQDTSKSQINAPKPESLASDEKDSNDKSVMHGENAEYMETEKEVVERIISTRGKIYKIAKSPENARNIESIKNHLQDEEKQNKEISEPSTSEDQSSSSSRSVLNKNKTTDIDDTIILSKSETSDTDDNTILNESEMSDTSKINFKRTISTRKKTYVYSGNESSRGDEDSVSGNSETEFNVAMSEKNSTGTLKLEDSESVSFRVTPENSDKTTKQHENSDKVTSGRRTRNKCYVLKDVDIASDKEIENKEFTNLETSELKNEENTTNSGDTRPNRHTRSKDRNDNKPYITLRNLSERKSKKDICYLDLSRNGRKDRDRTDSKESAGSSLDRNTRSREHLSRKSEEYISSRKSRSRTNSGTSHTSEYSDDKLKTPKLNNEDFELKRRRESRRQSDNSSESKKPKIVIQDIDDIDVKSECPESEESKGLIQEKTGGTPDSGRISTRSGSSQTKSSSTKSRSIDGDTKVNLFPVSPVKTRSRSSPGSDKNNFQHGNVSQSRETSRKLVTTSQRALQKCFKDLQKKGKDCKDKFLNTISARKSNLRSSFASKYGRGSIFGIRAQRLLSRNEKKENSLKKLMSSKKRATSREIISKSLVSCNVETAINKYVTEKPNTRNTPNNKRLSTDEELLAAAGCLESSRRLRVNLDRNVTELLNKDKNLTCVKLENEKEAGDDENKDKSQNTGNSISIPIGEDSECEESSKTRKLRDRKRIKRKDLHFDSDDEINQEKNIDKDYEISDSEEYEEESDDSKEEEVLKMNRKKRKVEITKYEDKQHHKLQEMKNKKVKEQLICGSIDDEEFAFVKTPVLCDNTEKQTKEGTIDSRNRPQVDNKAAFIESFKSYIDTARSNNSYYVVTEVPRQQRDITSELMARPQQGDMSSHDLTAEGSSAFLDSFKMYIDKNRDNQVVIPNRIDKEKKFMLDNKAESKERTDKKRSKSGENRKTSNNNDKVKERRNSEGGSKQSENITISAAAAAATPVSDYLKNFKAYISQRSEGTNADTVDNKKVSQQNLTKDKTVKSDDYERSICSKDSSLFDEDTNKSYSESSSCEGSNHSDTMAIPSIDDIQSKSESSVSAGSNQSNSGSNSCVDIIIQSNKSVNKPGHSSFLDSFLAHCGKGNELSDNKSDFICESTSSNCILGINERKKNTEEDEINKEDRTVDTLADCDRVKQHGKDQIKGDKSAESVIDTGTPNEELTQTIEDEQSCSGKSETSEISIQKVNLEMSEIEEKIMTEKMVAPIDGREIFKDEGQNMEISMDERQILEISNIEVKNLEASMEERHNLDMKNEHDILEISKDAGGNLEVFMDKEQNVEIYLEKEQNIEISEDLDVSKNVEDIMENSIIEGEKVEISVFKEKEKTVYCDEEISSSEIIEDTDLTERHNPRMIIEQNEETITDNVIPSGNKTDGIKRKVTQTSQLTSELTATITEVESFQKDIISSPVTGCVEEDLSQNSGKEQVDKDLSTGNGQVDEDLSQNSDKEQVDKDLSQNSDKGQVDEDLSQNSDKGQVDEDLSQNSDKGQVDEDLSQNSDKGQVDEDLSQNSDKGQVDEDLSQNSDKGQVDEDLSHNSDKEQVDEDLSQNSDKGQVDEDLSQNSDKGQVDEDLSQNSDKEQVDMFDTCERKVSGSASPSDNAEIVCQQNENTNSVMLNLENEYHYENQSSETSNLENKIREKPVILNTEKGNNFEPQTRPEQEICFPVPVNKNENNDEIQEKGFEISNGENEEQNELHKDSEVLSTENVYHSEQGICSATSDLENENQTKTLSAVDNVNESVLENKCTVSDVKSEFEIEDQSLLSTLTSNKCRNNQQSSGTSNIENEYRRQLQQQHSVTSNIGSEKSSEIHKPSIICEQDNKMYESSITVEMNYQQDDQNQAGSVLLENLPTSSVASDELLLPSSMSSEVLQIISLEEENSISASLVNLQASSGLSEDLQTSSVISSLSSGELQASSESSRNLQTSSVISTSFNELQTSSVSSTELQTSSVSSTELQTSSVSSEEPQTSSMSSTELQTSSVSSTEFQTSSVSSKELQTSSVSSEEPQTSSVSSEELQTSSVSSEEPKTSSVSSTELQTSSVSSEEPQTSSVSSEEPQTSSVSSEEPQTSSVSSEELQTSSVSSTEIQTSSVSLGELIPRSQSSENLHLSSKQTEKEMDICSAHGIKENDNNKTLWLGGNVQTQTTSKLENVIQIQMMENYESVPKSEVIVDQDQDRKTDSSQKISTQSDNAQTAGKSDSLDNHLQSMTSTDPTVIYQTMDKTNSSQEISTLSVNADKQVMEKSCSLESHVQVIKKTETAQNVDETNSVNEVIVETMETDLSIKPVIMNKIDCSVEQVARETMDNIGVPVQQVTKTHVKQSETEETTEKTGSRKTTVKLKGSDITNSSSTTTVNKDKPETSIKIEKKKPILKSVSCQSGPATVRISSVQDDNKGKKNVKSKSVMTSTQDLRPNTRQSKLDAKRYGHLARAKGMDNLPYKGIIELPSDCIDKSNVQLPDLPPINTFQKSYETSDNTTSSIKTRSSSRVEKTTTSEEQSDNKDSIQIKKKRTSALKSLRENIPDTPFTWDMDEGVDSIQARDKNYQKKSTDKNEGRDQQSGSSSEQSNDNKKHSVDLLTSRKPHVDSELTKKSESCHDDNISIISDDTKSLCSNSDHTDTESAHSGTSSVERIVPKPCSGKHTNKVRHIYHHGKIWNIGKGHVTSVPVHQVQEETRFDSGHKSEGSVSLHRHDTVLQVIEVDRKHDAGGKHVVGVTEDEEFSEFHTYTSRDVSNLKNKTESEDKPAKRWKIEQGKRKNVSKSGATYPYVFKKSRKK